MHLPASLAATLRGGGSVVTSSARAARALRRLYGEAQREQGRIAWRDARIVDWDSWLEHLWLQNLRSGGENRLLLSPVQEHETWVRLVEPAIEGRRLISVDGVADLAQEAYALVCGYDARSFLHTRALSADVDSFCEWARDFEDECRKREWLSRSMLPLALAEALRQSDAGERLCLPARVALIGFDRLRPAEQLLIGALEGAGCAVERVVSEPSGTVAEAPVNTLVAAADRRDEITTCAWWARRTLESAARENKPLRIAVIVPDVARARGEMERIFRQVLAAPSIPVGARELPVPFEFSLGAPLAEVPCARAALLLLRWMEEALPQAELSWLLLSGFLWRDAEDLLPLAALDAAIRRQAGVLPPEYSLSTCLRQRGWRDSEAAQSMRHRLHAARRAWHEGGDETLTFAQWVERAERILTAAGWPGPHRMDDRDFQARRKWTQLLDGLAALAFDGRQVSYRKFLRALERQAAQTIFSPRSAGAAVEILGPFEAAGMEWDAIWFLGADDARWPAPARPHPFLTKSLQKDRGMPHADLGADWEIARLVANRVLSSAPRCILSYPVQDEEGERRPSTALGGPLEQVSSARMREKLGVTAADLDDLREFPALVVENEDAANMLPWPKEREAGGVGTLQMQARCPFQAFATMRLGARELDRADWGLDPAERGRLVHRALEGAWGELQDRDTLIRAKISGRLHEIIAAHVHQAVAQYARETNRGSGAEDNREHKNDSGQSDQEKWSRAYLQVESERVVKLVEEWLAYEEQRPPFLVAAREQTLPANVGELRLKLRADRIDEIEGGRLLIDYKTGKVSAHAWEGERPDEPQLPLYAAYGNVPALRGALLAQIRSGDLKFEGCIDDPGNTLACDRSRLSPYSEDLRQQWERILLALSEQFLRGEAQVDPKHYPDTCAICALPGLCRVAEKRLAEEETG